MCESPAIAVCLGEDAEPNMGCHGEEDLVGWKDFPKGLRVLLLVEDGTSAADIKSKLEQMDYIVSLFRDEKEALKAVSSKAESFHVAIIEVTTGNSLGCFRFLEAARGLPAIMVSEAHCISTMIKCIALGAAEFLQKPVSEEKLRNIWQHVVHKAFNAGSAVVPKSLMPIKETVASILQLLPDSGAATELKDQESSMEDAAEVDDEQEGSQPSDKFPAPSTPQLEQSSRPSDDGDCQDRLKYCSIDESKYQVRDSMEQTRLWASESKSVDNTCNNSAGEIFKEEPSTTADFSMEDEIDSACGSKTAGECTPAAGDDLVPSPRLNHEEGATQNGEGLNQKKASPQHRSSYLGGGRSNKRRIKVDWTPDLHKRFVQAVEQLGIDQAIPSKILELMKTSGGLTRHNVASHLQKYRMRKRHILPKDEDRRWQQHGNQVPARAYPYKQQFAAQLLPPPPPRSSCGGVVLPPAGRQVYHVWGHPNYHHPGVQMWGNTGYSPWQQPSGEYWPWKTYPRMHADAWGCPVAPPQNLYPAVPQYSQNLSFDVVEHRNGMPSKDAYDFRAAEEVIDEVVREALRKPWLPLPLGLKPPSTESVLTELHRRGVHSVPPR